MERIESYRVFACLAECQSFTGTAARLGLSKAMVSSAIRGLEAQLRARLFNRTTRSVRLSQDGSAFFERCVSLLADIDELDGVFREGTSVLSGRLRIDLPTRVASNLIIPRLPDFLAAHPAVQLELS